MVHHCAATLITKHFLISQFHLQIALSSSSSSVPQSPGNIEINYWSAEESQSVLQLDLCSTQHHYFIIPESDRNHHYSRFGGKSPMHFLLIHLCTHSWLTFTVRISWWSHCVIHGSLQWCRMMIRGTPGKFDETKPRGYSVSNSAFTVLLCLKCDLILNIAGVYSGWAFLSN